MILHLIRHGAAADVAGRCVGHADVPLADTGRAQLAALAARWTPPADARLVASDLARAHDSARALAAAWGRDVDAIPTDARLREMDFGRWDGATWDEIERRDGDALGRWMAAWAEVATPDGEGFPQLRDRAAAWLDAAVADAAPDATLVAVAHAGSIRALVCHALALPLDAAFRLRVEHARVTTLKLPAARGDAGCAGAGELVLLNGVPG